MQLCTRTLVYYIYVQYDVPNAHPMCADGMWMLMIGEFMVARARAAIANVSSRTQLEYPHLCWAHSSAVLHQAQINKRIHTQLHLVYSMDAR